MMFVNPSTKFGFERIFGQAGHKRILVEFVNAVFEGEYRVKDVTYQDAGVITGPASEQRVIHGIFCTRDSGTPMIVEVQNRDTVERFMERVQYFQASAIASQGETVGSWKLPALFVYILGFKRKELGEAYRVDLGMKEKMLHGDPVEEQGEGDQEDGFPKELMRMTFLQMPAFDKSEAECSTELDKWCYILKNMASLERIPWADQNDVFAELEQVARLDSLNTDDRRAYEESCEELTMVD